MVQKRTPWKESQKVYKTHIYLQSSQTYTWIFASKLSTGAHIRYSINFSSHVLDFANPSRNAKNSLVFLGEPFQWRFPDNHLHRSLLCSEHRSRFCFSISVLYFSSVSVFVPLYDFYLVNKKKTYKLFAKFLTINLCVIEKYIVNVTYVVDDNRLGCFVSEKQTRKITSDFHSEVCEAVHRLFD